MTEYASALDINWFGEADFTPRLRRGAEYATDEFARAHRLLRETPEVRSYIMAENLARELDRND